MSHAFRPPLRYVLLWLAFPSLVVLSPLDARAQSISIPESDLGKFGVAAAGATITVGAMSLGQKFAQSSPKVAPAVASATVSMSRSLALQTPAGASFTATASGLLNKAALGRVLAAGLRGSGYLAAGVALYEVAKSMGWLVSKDENGDTVFIKPDPAVCTQSPCYEYQGNPYVGITDTPDYTKWYPTAYDAAMSWTGPIVNGQQCQGSSSYRSKLLSLSGTYAMYEYRRCDDNSLVGSDGMTVGQVREVPPSSQAGTRATADDFAAAVAANGSTSPYLAQAVADALHVPAGSIVTPVDLDQITVSGPSTTPVSTTVATATDGKTTTTKTYDKHTYAQNTVTSARQVDTQTYDPATGQTTTSGATTEIHNSAVTSNVDVPDPCTGAAAGTVGCMSPGEPPPGEAIKSKTYAYTPKTVAFASGAGCPSPVAFTAMGRSYSISWQPMCDAMGWIKALILAISFFIAAWIMSDSFKVQ